LKIVSKEELNQMTDNHDHELLAWVPKDNKNQSIFIAYPLPGTANLAYSMAHEILHLHDKSNEERWVKEGLAELFASEITTWEPLNSIHRFLSYDRPLQLNENNFSNFSIYHYGQSYLY